MASSTVMPSTTKSRSSDLTRQSSSTASSATKSQYPQQLQHHFTSSDQMNGSHDIKFTPTMTLESFLQNVHAQAESTLLDASISLVNAPAPTTSTLLEDTNCNSNSNSINNNNQSQYQNTVASVNFPGKSVDDVWREIVSGERKEMKEEAADELITLEDFLARTEAVEQTMDDIDVKVHPERLSGGVYAFDQVAPNHFQVEGGIIGFGNGVEVIGACSASSGGGSGGKGKRGRLLMEPIDKATQQRQKRMIKNRESAARSRERKQAYQEELESVAIRLEHENERLLKEKAERTRERYNQLMEMVVPVVEKRKPPRVLRRVRSLEW